MTNEERNAILAIALDFNVWANYIKVLAKRETDEREEIIEVCKSMNKRVVNLMDSVQQNHTTSKVADINDTISMALMLMFDETPETNGLSKVDYIAKDRNITKDEAKEVLDHISTLSEMMRNDDVL